MTPRNDIPVLVIFGPTASGKTALAGSLFASVCSDMMHDGLPDFFCGKVEIISADSMQVYRGMDIGTAKPDASFLKKLPHHLIDICDPREQFCAGDFVRLADIACADIHSRRKLPVILGGTAFYIRNFLYGLPETPESDPEVRRLLQQRMRREGSGILWHELDASDPERAAMIHKNDEYRIIRALEIFAVSGRSVGSFGIPLTYRSGYRFLVISLDRPRNELYTRIDQRVIRMFEDGLAEEFHSLLEAGYSASDPGMQAIGYREFFMTEPPGSDPEKICAQIQHDSRKYAKRQETFIRSMPNIRHISADDIQSCLDALIPFYTA